jgi:hypothetical protein
MHQEVKSINEPFHWDPGPSSSQPSLAVPPSDHQKPARVPHAPIGALLFSFYFLCIYCVFRRIELELEPGQPRLTQARLVYTPNYIFATLRLLKSYYMSLLVTCT